MSEIKWHFGKSGRAAGKKVKKNAFFANAGLKGSCDFHTTTKQEAPRWAVSSVVTTTNERRFSNEQQTEKGRASKGAALAYLGKVQLYQKDWAGAKSSLEKVVNSGRYSLNPCFHDIFSTAGENGAETIFSIQASVNDGSVEGENGNLRKM